MRAAIPISRDFFFIKKGKKKICIIGVANLRKSFDCNSLQGHESVCECFASLGLIAVGCPLQNPYKKFQNALNRL